eukprot:gene5013-6242_t
MIQNTEVNLNQYDKQEVLDNFREMVSKGYFHRYFEHLEMEKQLPNLNGVDLVELGCGFGTFAKRLLEKGLKSYVGIDLSKNMVEESKKLNESDPRASFQNCSVEDYDYPTGTLDVVVSSYVLQLVKDYQGVIEKVYKSLKPGGKFIFTVTHPIKTAGDELIWHKDENGNVKGWVVNDFHKEGLRETAFIVDRYFVFHRTTETYVNALLKTGFKLEYLGEPLPDLNSMPEEFRPLFDHKPIMLLLAVSKPLN